MAPSQVEAAAQQLLAGLPQRLDQVFRPWARSAPKQPALIGDGKVWTYGALAGIVDDVAAELSKHGVRPGDRVMVVSENSPALAALILAISALDAWSVSVNPRLSEREIDQIRGHCGARVLYYTVEVSELAAAHARRHEAHEVEMGPLGTLAVSPLNEATEPEPVAQDSAQQVAALLYTSGTTGNPKGVMLSHRNILFNASVSRLLRKPTPEDIIYGVLPMSHIVGFSIILAGTLIGGSAVHLVPKYDPAAFVGAVRDHGISLLFGVPTTYQRLLEYKATAGLNALPRGRLRGLYVAGAPLDPTLKAMVEQEFGLPLLNGYGITECAPGISGVRAEAPRSDTSVGTVIPGIEVRLVGRDGAAVAEGTVGELHVRGPNVMRGYYRAPEATAAAIDKEGWFNTGDLARFEGETLFIAGRTKELIIRSGFNVYPAEVEAVLNAHPAVMQSAAVGRAVQANEEVVAYVQLLAGAQATVDDLMAHAARQLTAYKRPSEIVILEALPTSSAGKILKHRLSA
ncbi:class I adenylate-forming enzyme family protein [Reyranella soli]|uniref:AMP-binding protein n=1 Tax=Reyranella soli TaxID=1230389 RepID=A0A512NBT4_9HYPH|nr:class I adenylate-forming enzyme family protein [Reyranella soli]GEP56406.1 AMP-binding protein [Reyranella soli]